MMDIFRASWRCCLEFLMSVWSAAGRVDLMVETVLLGLETLCRRTRLSECHDGSMDTYGCNCQ